jgi:isopentenyl diphosphate isomerase/L-lactate dehydrogenase-like FMN-dependent dehydrogenase
MPKDFNWNDIDSKKDIVVPSVDAIAVYTNHDGVPSSARSREWARTTASSLYHVRWSVASSPPFRPK